jgi:Transglutaminase-like superfamily
MTAVAGATPRRFSAPRRALLAAEIGVTYLRVRRVLRTRDLPSTLAALRAPGRRPRSPESAHPQLGLRLGRAVALTLERLPADSRCLTQSLVLTRLLAVRGLSSVLVIGVSAPGEPFGAHAWVERDGTPLLPVAGAAGRRLVEL